MVISRKQLLDLRSLDETQQAKPRGGGEDERVGEVRRLMVERQNYEEALFAAYVASYITRQEFLTLSAQ